MKICFYGVGGVGGYFGSLVTRKFNEIHDFYFVARGKHKDAICSNGLTLKKSGGEEIINVMPKKCTDTADDLPVCDIIVVSVKSYDLANVAREMVKITGEKTIILPLLNGVDIYERIRLHLSSGIVFPSCVYVGTHIESPGVIFQKGGSCKISLGKDPQSPDFYPEALLKLLKESGIHFSWEDNVNVSIWSKYMFIAAYGLVTAAFNKTLGEVLEDPELGKLTREIMFEIETIAKKLNIALPLDIVGSSFVKAGQFPYEAKTSFQRDVEAKGKINEGDLFGGTIMRFGERLGIPTPQTRKVYEMLLQLL
ncbi:MAG: 2-dehydropantoate 2-reductase [Bacteroidales bacterium]|nr:2-dehydropantoate 2-reductase [Bacteroidales bacterium]